MYSFPSETGARRFPWWTAKTAVKSLGLGGFAITLISLCVEEQKVRVTHLGWKTVALFIGLSFIVGYFLTWLARVVAPWVGLVDIPKGRKCHARPTPLLGGLAVVA